MHLSVRHSQINGETAVPGSKSHTIRALAIASLAKGSSVIKAPLVSDDTLSCLSAACALGAWVRRGDDSLWQVIGTGGRMIEPARPLNMGNSGTGLRIFSALAALSSSPISFGGDESLQKRPMEPLLAALNDLGAKTESDGGHCPLTVTGPIRGGETSVDGTSSQYLSALLLAAPLAEGDTILNVPFLNEVPYVEMTLAWLKRQNINLKYNKNYTRFHVIGGQQFKPFNETIPGDFSTAAFPLAAAIVTGGGILIRNLDFNDPQGDKAFVELAGRMGARIETGPGFARVKPGPVKLHAAELDLNATPDLLPVLSVVAACADGITVLKNVAQARLKETDRIAVMAHELGKMGIQVEEFEDGMAITGGKLKPAHVDSFRDHRVAMSLAIAGMTCAADEEEPTLIDSAESIGVTYPSFVDDFSRLGADFYAV